MKKITSLVSIVLVLVSGLIVSCSKEESATPITEKPKDFAGVEAGATNEKKPQSDSDNGAASKPPSL